MAGIGCELRKLLRKDSRLGLVPAYAYAGVIGTCLVFSTPGSSNAVALAMEKLIVPELQHLVYELRKQLPGAP